MIDDYGIGTQYRGILRSGVRDCQSLGFRQTRHIGLGRFVGAASFEERFARRAEQEWRDGRWRFDRWAPVLLFNPNFWWSLIALLALLAALTALLVQLAYDAKLGRPIQLGRYVGPAMSAVVPLAILSIVTTILVMLGMMLFIVPGLWVYAVFCVLAPAIVIEGQSHPESMQ